MENSSSQCLKKFEVPYKCDKCEREFKRRSSLTRHIHSKHEPIDVTLCKVKLKNENLLLQIGMYYDQIKFLKKLILILKQSQKIDSLRNK